LAHRLRDQHKSNITVAATNDTLYLTVVRETAKAAQRDGVKPMDKKLLFAKLLQPDVETTVCNYGFRTIRATVNGNPPNELKLNCPVSGP
jgi:hypothetical protein